MQLTKVSSFPCQIVAKSNLFVQDRHPSVISSEGRLLSGIAHTYEPLNPFRSFPASPTMSDRPTDRPPIHLWMRNHRITRRDMWYPCTNAAETPLLLFFSLFLSVSGPCLPVGRLRPR